MLIAAGILGGVMLISVVIRFILAQIEPDNDGRDECYTDFPIVQCNTARTIERRFAEERAAGKK